MTQYIDKAALVAELDRLYDLEYDGTSDLSCGKKMMLRHILLFLNTLEVKEEVTTTDAFIEKACEWMSSHLQMQYDGFGSFIKDFRKTMKG